MYTRCSICGVKQYQSLVWFLDKVFAHNPCVDCCEKYDIA